MGGADCVGWFSWQAAPHLVPGNDGVLREAVPTHDPGDCWSVREAAWWRLRRPEEWIGVEPLLVVALKITGKLGLRDRSDLVTMTTLDLGSLINMNLPWIVLLQAVRWAVLQHG